MYCNTTYVSYFKVLNVKPQKNIANIETTIKNPNNDITISGNALIKF